MRALIMAVLALSAYAQPDKSPPPAGGAEQTIQEQSGQLKSTPWANTGGDAGTARGAPQQPREIEAAGVLGVAVIAASLFALGQRRRIKKFDNPGGTEPPHKK